MNGKFTPILRLFTSANQTSQKFIVDLLTLAEMQLGQSVLDKMDEWKTLSESLNSPTKINCLQDKNHRALIVGFLRQGATQFYKCSYFNNAKIDSGYLPYLKSIGPIEFIEIIKIVNKLKLVEKHFRTQMEKNIFTQNHIEQYIRKIMEKCNSSKRKINSNFEKFKAIVEFEDRLELIKELGKLLRKSWSSQKQKIKDSVVVQNEAIEPVLVSQQWASQINQQLGEVPINETNALEQSQQIFGVFFNF